MLTLRTGAREPRRSPAPGPRPGPGHGAGRHSGAQRCAGTEGEARGASGWRLRGKCWCGAFTGGELLHRRPRAFGRTRRPWAAASRAPNRLQLPGATAARAAVTWRAAAAGGVASGSFPAHAQPPRVLTTTTRASSAPRPGGRPPLGGADWASCTRAGVPLARRGAPGGGVTERRQTRGLPGGERRRCGPLPVPSPPVPWSRLRLASSCEARRAREEPRLPPPAPSGSGGGGR